MSLRSAPVLKALVFSAAILLVPVSAQAGEHVRAGKQVPAASQPVPVPVVRVLPSVTISLLAATPTQAANEAAYINLRGPDGQLRRFAVEGGAAELASRVVVLRPGESLTILWMPRK
jgi:hypothetical protein